MKNNLYLTLPFLSKKYLFIFESVFNQMCFEFI